MGYGRFTGIQVLQAIRRELLKEFASRFESELAERRVILPKQELTDNDFYAAWRKLLMSPEGLPDRTNEVLHAVHVLATPEGFERLKKAIQECNLSLPLDDKTTPEEYAIRAWMHYPKLLARKYYEQRLGRLSRFDYFHLKQNISAWGDQSAGSKGRMDSLIFHLDLWYAANGRGVETAVVEEYPLNEEQWYLIRHGDTFTHSAKVEKRNMEVLHYRPAKDDLVVYSPKREELRINAKTKGEKDLYREAFGFFLHGFKDCFEETKTYTLEPLRKLRKAALECDDIQGLDKVVLTKLDLDYGNGKNQGYTLRASDVFDCSWVPGATEFILPNGAKLVRAGFQVFIKGFAKPVELQIKPPNTLRLGRHDAVQRVHEWLSARGFKGDVKRGRLRI